MRGIVKGRVRKGLGTGDWVLGTGYWGLGEEEDPHAELAKDAED